MDYRDFDNFSILEQNMQTGQKKRIGEVHTRYERLKEKRRQRQKLLLQRTAAAAIVIGGIFSGYGIYTAANQAKVKANKLMENVNIELAEIKEKRQKYVYTNMPTEEFGKLSFEEQVQMYENYFDKVTELAPYSPEGVSQVNNYDLYRSKAKECMNDINAGKVPYEMIEFTKRNIIDYYKKGLECVEFLYGDKFSFNNVTADAIILNEVNLEEGRAL